MYSFDGKVVWVTGSSTGIGRAIALGFANHGADLVVHCHSNLEETKSLAAEIQDIGRKCIIVQGDVADKNQVDQMVHKIKNYYGSLHILINNAGSLIRRARIEELDEELWDRVMNVNLKSVFLVTKAILPLMKSQGKGKIINITSVAARNGGGLGSIPYATAKAGVSNFTRGLAKDLIEHQILVNGIAPGVISTPFHEKFTSLEARQKMVEQIPLQREGNAEEVVGAALFLASDYANYITGEIIEVNGGQVMN
jgi:3-oxoacyl-[acyl-carrier protein] reductase